MQEKGFQKKKEDFVCENCGRAIRGSGYTDHCPSCLFSKHVDINPGDRKSDCGGKMIPKEIETRGDDYIIYYQCQKCGYKHRIKSSPDDNFEELLKLRF